MSATAKNCGHCQKSSLSLLLLRAGPMATHSDLQPIGAAHAVADEALVKPFIAQGLTDSRPVLRLLRAGYVHAYIPKTGRWRTWRVTEQADLLAQDHPLFAVPAVDATCTRKAHNASGFKLLALPDAHTLVGQPIWLAFSANLWSGKLKTQNQANPKAMVQITLGTAAAPAFKPDAQSLKRQMLECNALHWRLPKADPGLQPVFAFNSLAMDAQVQHLAQTLQQAASSHPQTAGHELAVVLPDPAGYAAELNALRLARFELARQEAARPENAHPLTSLQMLDGLRQIVVDEKEARSFEAVSPRMSAGAFKDTMRVKPNPRGWPEGTRWEPDSPPSGRPVLGGHGMGRVIFPDHAARAARWAQEAAERNWQRYRRYVDEDRIRRWQAGFDQKMQAAHGEALKRLEADWWRARQHSRFTDYFALHFDDQEPNRVGTAQDHSAGAAYAQEVSLSMTPQPLVRGPTLDAYLAELGKPATDPSAQLQRALAGNQGTVLAALADYAQGNRPDKLHDLAAGLLKGADEAAILGQHHLKYSWMLHAGYGLNTLAITQSLTAAVAAVLAGVGGKGPRGEALVQQLESLLMGSKAMLLARQSAAQGTRLQVPVRFMAQVPLDDALQALAQEKEQGRHSGHTPSQTEQQLRRRAHGNGTVRVAVVSTNLELQAVQGDVKAALAAGTARIDLASAGAAGSMVSAVPVIQLSRRQFKALLKHQSSLWEKAAVALRESVQGIRGGTLSLDGHIGLVALMLNGVSVVGSANDTWASGDFGKWLAFADSAAGTLGGLAQVTQSAMSASIAHRAGHKAAEKSLWVMGAGVVASGAGAFGGLATAAGQAVKAGRSLAKEQHAEFALYSLSGLSFLAQGSTNLIQFSGAFSEFMIARGSQRAIWFTGARLAAGASARLVALTGLGLTGWGLVFLAGGLIFEVGVVLLTPDALQQHIQNSYFGQGGEAKAKYKTLADEERGIMALSSPPQSAARKASTPMEEQPFSDPMTGFMTPL